MNWLREKIQEAIQSARRQASTGEQTFNWYRLDRKKYGPLFTSLQRPVTLEVTIVATASEPGTRESARIHTTRLTA